MSLTFTPSCAGHRYPSRPTETVLHNFTMKIPRNKSMALVGSSGSGKSTIVQLLLRFYDPVEGTIRVNGVDIKEYNIASLRRVFGLISQEPTLFADTISANIAYGKPSLVNLDAEEIPASELETIEEAAQQANADGFIQTFGNKYVYWRRGR